MIETGKLRLVPGRRLEVDGEPVRVGGRIRDIQGHGDGFVAPMKRPRRAFALGRQAPAPWGRLRALNGRFNACFGTMDVRPSHAFLKRQGTPRMPADG